MAFRKFRRMMPRRRRRRSETNTLLQCHHCDNVYGDCTCTSPLIDAIPIMTMSTQRSLVDTTEVSNPSDRFVVVDGLKFTSIFSHDPGETQGCSSCDPAPIALAFNLLIWEAIVVLPLSQGTTNVPNYLPVLSNSNFQSGDIADRVLWKRLTSMPIWGVGVVPLPQLVSTDRFGAPGHGPVVVKSKVRLDDRHGLFYVKNFVHDIALGFVPGSSCTPDCVTSFCAIPIINDAWFKVFYHTRK